MIDGDKAREQWLTLPDEEKPVMHCRRCGCELFEDDYCWDLFEEGEYTCEDCIDEVVWMMRIKVRREMV